MQHQGKPNRGYSVSKSVAHTYTGILIEGQKMKHVPFGYHFINSRQQEEPTIIISRLLLHVASIHLDLKNEWNAQNAN